jgi:hypothetical protein
MSVQNGPTSCKISDPVALKSPIVIILRTAGSIMKRTDPNTRTSIQTTLRKSRPLTSAQEIVLIAAAFVAGGMLQALLILHIGGILD